jgi:LysR family transcriptional regulator for bpeEF and oprC
MTVFVRVAECGSFSRAAESLDLANATVTTCVRNLERHLGVTLIHRDTRRLHLTEEGTLFLGRARDILRSVEDAESEVQARVGELRGPLHIEMPISIGRALVGPALPKFAALYPGLSTSITLSNEPNHVIASGIDVAIRMDRVEDAGLVARPIYETAYIVCCTPGMAAALPGHPAQLNSRLCLGIKPEDRRTSNPWHLARGEESLVIQPQGPLHFNSSDALLQAVCEGAGIGYVLDVFANRMIAAGELVQVYPDWTTMAKTFYAVTAKHRATTAKVRAFTDFLMEILDSERRPHSGRRVEVRAIGKR